MGEALGSLLAYVKCRSQFLCSGYEVVTVGNSSSSSCLVGLSNTDHVSDHTSLLLTETKCCF